MYQLLESVYLENGVFRNLDYHEARMRAARLDLFNFDDRVDLAAYLNGLNIPKSGLFKTRIIYDKVIREVEFVPYSIKPVRSLRLIHADTVSYSYKFLDRSVLQELYDQRAEADDILIVKNGFITDSSYANVIFRKENAWYTPQHCLLRGTMRQYLLDTGQIQEAIIDKVNYLQYDACKLINSMLEMDAEEFPIETIQ